MYKLTAVFISSIFTILLLSGCSAVGKNANDIISLVESHNYEEAQRKLDELEKGDSLSEEETVELHNKINKEISTKIETLVTQFENGEVDVAKLNDMMNGYKSLGLEKLSKQVNEERKSIKVLIKSRNSFTKGIKHIENEQYEKAIINLSNVIKDDIYYEKSQQNITEHTPELMKQIKEEVNQKNNKQEFQLAYEFLKDRQKYFNNNDSYNDLLGEYEQIYYENSINLIETLRLNKEYEKAIEELQTLNGNIDSNENIKKLLKEVKEENREENHKRKKQLISKMNKQYDSMDDITRFAPKGVDPFTLNIPKGGFVFYPMVQLSGQEIDSGIMAITAVAGFSQDDWVFMDRISFNVDGQRFTWELSFGESGSQVGNGIYEWVLKNNLRESYVKDDIETIANGQSVTIRFDGDTNSRDEQLSKEQIQQFKDALELFELLNKYGL